MLSYLLEPEDDNISTFLIVPFGKIVISNTALSLYYDWKKAVDAIDEAKEMIKAEHDEEMKSFLKAEMTENEAKLPEYEERMKVLLVPWYPIVILQTLALRSCF